MSSPYDFFDSFTLHDASFLLLNFDPLPIYPRLQDDESKKKYHIADAMTEQLMASVKSGQLAAIKKDIGSDWCLAGPPEWEIKRSDLKKWAAERKINAKFLFPEERSLNNDSEQCKHTTPEFKAMKDVIKEYWENYDPSHPPKKTMIVEALVKKGVGKTLAAKLDTAMRPQELRKGGNKPRSSNKKSN